VSARRYIREFWLPILGVLLLAVCAVTFALSISAEYRHPVSSVVEVTIDRKVVAAGWREGGFWYTTRPMRPSEGPEALEYSEATLDGGRRTFKFHETISPKVSPLPTWRPGEAH
jgi:hypothetical protein